MSAEPPDPQPVETPHVVVPQKAAVKALHVWLLAAGALLFALTTAAPEAAALGIGLPAWLLLVLKVLGTFSTALGVVIRVAMPDLVSGIPWLDRANARAAAPSDPGNAARPTP